jgi:competence protein ComEC
LPPPAAPASGAFRLTALDVGQGAAIVIETARHALLFDAGPGPESTRAGERIVAPYLHANGVSALDTLIVSHPDADHAGGAAAVLEAVGVRQVLGGLPPGHRLWATGDAMGAETLRCAAGQRWQWDGVTFAVLWPRPGPLPRESNARSCVLKVEADGFTALLTGDIDAAVERALVRSETGAPHAGSAGNAGGTAASGRLSVDGLAGIVATGGTLSSTGGTASATDGTARDETSTALAADVLIVAHHGSKTSSTESFLDSVRPRVAVFQVGYGNRFGHPHPDVWSRFAARGIELARTDRDGAARIELDGGILTLERYRDTHRRYWMDGKGVSQTAVRSSSPQGERLQRNKRGGSGA